VLHTFLYNVKPHGVALSRTARGYRLHWGARQIDCHLHAQAQDGCWTLHVAGHTLHIHAVQHGDDIYLHLHGRSHHLRYQHPLERLAQQQGDTTQDVVYAPMPGSIIAVAVQPGQSVTRGQSLLVMESMKMQTTLVAQRDGVVAQLACTPGQAVARDALLLSLVPADVVQIPQEGMV